MRTGDIRVPSYTSREQYIQNAAEEIEIALGHLYVTPFTISDIPANRPTIKFLKKVNWLLASGRFILDVAAAGEQDNLHAYGKRMLDEAMVMLADAVSGKITLDGMTPIPRTDDTDWRGPHIHNEDAESLVESFYRSRRPVIGGLGESLPRPIYPVVPYGN